MSQAEISRIEQRSDILLSTLRKLAEATGGELQLIVRYRNPAAVRSRERRVIYST